MSKTVLVILLTSLTMNAPFLAEQKKFERVRVAIDEKQNFIEKELKKHQLTIDGLNLLFVAFKDEDVLDLYAKGSKQTAYKKILSYAICARSGELGPKRKAGDKQVPEGFYHIDRFNPKSNFLLSLGVNYPNKADKIKSTALDLGGDIFIHGSCVTIGCLPMTDDRIKEIYLLAVHAKNSGQVHIPVYIFPFRMTDKNMLAYKDKYGHDKELIHFWENLKTGYDNFMRSKETLKVSVTSSGDYSF